MKKLIDKLIILVLSLALYIPGVNSIYMIIPILTAIILSALLSYLEDERVTMASFAAYLAACFFAPSCSFFIPLLCYDAVLLKNRWIWVLSFLPLTASSTEPLFLSRLLPGVFIIAVFILKHRTVSFENLERDYHTLRDNTKEMSIQLEKRNKELLEKQDFEINLATANERNRIARDIHDNVGHLLSRSILQIGALLSVNKDETTKESLKIIKDTLSEAMNSIRESVHNLHEESIDLQSEIYKLIDNFEFCPVKFDYNAETNPGKNIKYCFIAVSKEALANIIKHSNATEALVSVREHPALYQLVIRDNGSNFRSDNKDGIGIKNITDRVSALGGNVNITTDRGFRIFISIPKGCKGE